MGVSISRGLFGNHVLDSCSTPMGEGSFTNPRKASGRARFDCILRIFARLPWCLMFGEKRPKVHSDSSFWRVLLPECTGAVFWPPVWGRGSFGLHRCGVLALFPAKHPNSVIQDNRLIKVARRTTPGERETKIHCRGERGERSKQVLQKCYSRTAQTGPKCS